MQTFLISHLPALLVALPLLCGFLMPVIGRAGPRVRNGWVLLGGALTAITGLLLAIQVLRFGPVTYVFGAAHTTQTLAENPAAAFPIRIMFEIDALSALMIINTTLATLAVIIYSVAAEAKQSGLDMFYALFYLLIAGVYGMVATGDLFNFFVFLEITSLAGAALVAYRIDRGVAVEAGLKYALLSTLAALAVLTAIGILFGQYNALNIAALASRLQFTPLDKVALCLLIVPLAMKCGAVPMHFWTPDVYTTAPSSVTAFLVISSQASLYGLFRVLFSLYGAMLSWATFGWFLIILGVLSAFIGVTMAIPQKDVKRLMAYHAVSQTGYMLLAVGVGLAVLGNASALAKFGRAAIAGGLFHIINYASCKGLLFLTAGAIFLRTGTRNLNRLGALGHAMPVTMVLFMIAALAIAGIPPFNGFASKLMIYQSVFHFSPLLAIVAMIVSILTLASFVKVFQALFMGPRRPEFANVREVPRPMLIGMSVLAAYIVIAGIFPQFFVTRMIAPAVNALLDRAGYIATILGGI